MLLSQSFFLGLIQGIAEWLPVSSSGHLVLAQKLMNIDVPVAFDVWLHFSTLLVILIFFRHDIGRIISAVLRWKTGTDDFKLAVFITLATIMTALVVFPLKNLFERAFSSLLAVSISFFITGMLLLFSEKNQKSRNFTNKTAASIGLMQGLAFLPGISRSGSTISTALLLGIKKDEAFKFSFLIAIPAILGSSILELPDLISSGIPFKILSAGFITAFFIGFLSLLALKKIIEKRKFHYFAYYCFAIAIITFLMHLKLK